MRHVLARLRDADDVSTVDREQWSQRHPEPPVELTTSLNWSQQGSLVRSNRPYPVIRVLVAVGTVALVALGAWLAVGRSGTHEEVVSIGENGDSAPTELAPLSSAPTEVPPPPSSSPPSDFDSPDQRGMEGEVTRRVEGRPDVYLGASAGPNGVSIVAIAAGEHEAGAALLADLPSDSYELRLCQLTVEELAALRTKTEAVLNSLGLGYSYSFDAGSCTLSVLVGKPTPDQLEFIKAELGPNASVLPTGEMILY
jgi:hypothetical protein